MFYHTKINRTNYNQYFLSTVELKYYNIIIDCKNFFDQAVGIDLRTDDNIQKITTRKRDFYAIGSLLDYPNNEIYYKMTTINLSKENARDNDPKALQ